VRERAVRRMVESSGRGSIRISLQLDANPGQGRLESGPQVANLPHKTVH